MYRVDAFPIDAVIAPIGNLLDEVWVEHACSETKAFAPQSAGSDCGIGGDGRCGMRITTSENQ